MRRRAHAVTVALGALLAFMFGLLGASPASAVTPLCTYDAAAYRYDAPALLCSSDTVRSYVRGSPTAPAAASWVTPVSVAGDGVAATTAVGFATNTGGGGLLSRLRAINWADDTGSISLPGNRLRPNFAAEGPHSTFRRGPDGSVTHYATWEPQSNPLNPAPWQMVKRVDVVGDPHFNKVTGTYVDTPHVQGPSIPGGVRPAEPWELP